MQALQIITEDVPDDTFAFRAKKNSKRPCTRPSLLIELNKVLARWHLNSKSLAFGQAEGLAQGASSSLRQVCCAKEPSLFACFASEKASQTDAQLIA